MLLVLLALFPLAASAAGPQPCSRTRSVWRENTGRETVEGCMRYVHDDRGRTLHETYSPACDGLHLSRRDFKYDGVRLVSVVGVNVDTNTVEATMRVSYNADGTENERCYWRKGQSTSCWRNVYVDRKLKYTILNNREAVTEYRFGAGGEKKRELTTYYDKQNKPRTYYDAIYDYFETGKVSRIELNRFDGNKRLYATTRESYDRAGRKLGQVDATPSGDRDTHLEYRYKLGEDGRVLQEREAYFKGTSRDPSMVTRIVYGYDCTAERP